MFAVLQSRHNVLGLRSSKPQYLASNNVLKHGETFCYPCCLRRPSAVGSTSLSSLGESGVSTVITVCVCVHVAAARCCNISLKLLMLRIASCGASGCPAIGTNMVAHKQIPRLGSCCASGAWMTVSKRQLRAFYVSFYMCRRSEALECGNDVSQSTQYDIYNYRRKFRSQTSDNMDRWKAEQGRGREKRKSKKKRRCRCAKR